MNDPLDNNTDNNHTANNHTDNEVDNRLNINSNRSQRRQSQIPEPTYREPAIRAQARYDLAFQHQNTSMSASQQRKLSVYNHITYLLYVLSYFTAGLLWVVPIVMNYVKRHDADHTWLATHFDWQIKTFWYSIIGFVIGAVMLLAAFGVFGIGAIADSSGMTYGSIALGGFGVFIIGITVIWHLYRIVRGWIALTDNRPVP